MKNSNKAILFVSLIILATILLIGIAWMPFWGPLVPSPDHVAIDHVPMHLNSSDVESICNNVVRKVVTQYTGYCDETDPVYAYTLWRQSEIDNAEQRVNRKQRLDMGFAVCMTILMSIAGLFLSIAVLYDAVQLDRADEKNDLFATANSHYTNLL